MLLLYVAGGQGMKAGRRAQTVKEIICLYIGALFVPQLFSTLECPHFA